MPYDNEISERFLIVFQFYKGLECSCSLLRLLKVFCDSPGQNGYIGSCRTGLKSVATRQIGFGRLLFAGFRCDSLCSFDIRWSDSWSSDQIHTFGTDQIRYQDLIISDLNQDNPVSRNGRYLSVHMTQDFRIKPFNHCHRNLSDYIWMWEFHWSDFFLSDNMDPTGSSCWCISKIIRKPCM